jgi:hypothetical protein
MVSMMISTGQQSPLSAASASDELVVLNGIRDLVDEYDTFLLDMW